MGKKILLPQDIAEAGKEYLRQRGYEIKMGGGTGEQQLMEDITDCSAVIARLGSFTENVIRSGRELRIIARHGAGYDNIDLKAAREKGVWVTNDPVSNAGAVAEHVTAMILNCAKHMNEMDDAVRSGNFQDRNARLTTEVEGKTLGIAGFGRIGRLVAKKAGLGLGMKILVYDAYPVSDETICRVETLERLMEQSDFVTVHMPLNESTRGIFGRELFGRMKRSAYFINAARGKLVQEDALAKALEEGCIAGAALDVFETEPPKQDNLLLAMNQVLLSPHNAALTGEAMERMALTAARAVDTLLSGGVPEYVILKGRELD